MELRLDLFTELAETSDDLNLVSPVGIEPTTPCLKGRCSTTELRARDDNFNKIIHLILALDLNIVKD